MLDIVYYAKYSFQNSEHTLIVHGNVQLHECCIGQYCILDAVSLVFIVSSICSIAIFSKVAHFVAIFCFASCLLLFQQVFYSERNASKRWRYCIHYKLSVLHRSLSDVACVRYALSKHNVYHIHVSISSNVYVLRTYYVGMVHLCVSVTVFFPKKTKTKNGV